MNLFANQNVVEATIIASLLYIGKLDRQDYRITHLISHLHVIVY